MSKDKTITFTVKNNFDLSEEEFTEELLLAETRMNELSKLRFHLQEKNSGDSGMNNTVTAKVIQELKIGRKYDLPFRNLNMENRMM